MHLCVLMHTIVVVSAGSTLTAQHCRPGAARCHRCHNESGLATGWSSMWAALVAPCRCPSAYSCCLLLLLRLICHAAGSPDVMAAPR